ncbi:hypothetical protein ABZ807_20040 [Micromonospora sp. NPDC047548]|uniref:hypothetical protein n=1 Tax=Micromonospora sp. NPDC047548 TaxID=3155624 RepID=UPI0033E3B500
MAKVFGEVADSYDEAPPGYPPSVAEAILACHGEVPAPQLRRPRELRERVLAAVGAAVDGFGGTVTLDLRTTLVLARRPR